MTPLDVPSPTPLTFVHRADELPLRRSVRKFDGGKADFGWDGRVPGLELVPDQVREEDQVAVARSVFSALPALVVAHEGVFGSGSILVQSRRSAGDAALEPNLFYF